MIHRLRFRIKRPHIVWLSRAELRCRILLGIWNALLLQYRQARLKHLETLCVPPELAVIAKLLPGFALFFSDIISSSELFYWRGEIQIVSYHSLTH